MVPDAAAPPPPPPPPSPVHDVSPISLPPPPAPPPAACKIKLVTPLGTVKL